MMVPLAVMSAALGVAAAAEQVSVVLPTGGKLVAAVGSSSSFRLGVSFETDATKPGGASPLLLVFLVQQSAAPSAEEEATERTRLLEEAAARVPVVPRGTATGGSSSTKPSTSAGLSLERSCAVLRVCVCCAELIACLAARLCLRCLRDRRLEQGSQGRWQGEKQQDAPRSESGGKQRSAQCGRFAGGDVSARCI